MADLVTMSSYLPFPLHDRMTRQEPLALLDLSKIHSLMKSVRDGRFDSCQFFPQARLSRSSLLGYLTQERRLSEERRGS